jgi:arsenical pump membrane protein
LIIELFSRILPILGFLICITVIAELADVIGVFRAAAYGAARLARGSVLVLWLLMVVIGAASSAVLSLDTTAVLITPVMLVLARRLDLDLRLFAYTAVWLANTASLLFPVSNLTNLLAMTRLESGVGGQRTETVAAFVSLMWPAAAAAFLITVGTLAVMFRRSLRGRYAMPGWRPVGDRVLFGLASGVCLGLGPAFTLGVDVLVAAGAGVLILVVGCLVRRPRLLHPKLLPWRLVLGTALLFVIVQIAHDHGLARLLAAFAGQDAEVARMAVTAAVAANLVNNLPAYLALEPLAGTLHRMIALLVGVNVGPLILPWGSLATLLWASRCRSAGVRVRWYGFMLRGLVLVPLLLAGCLAATLLVHRG